MSYETWRIAFQSSEQAARAAFDQYTKAQVALERASANIKRLQSAMTPELLDHEVTYHRDGVTPLTVFSAGKVGPGGAHNCYVIGEGPRDGLAVLQEIRFQQGHPNEQGFNGVTLEALLAVCMDCLESFQSGPYPCNHNQEALHHIERALEALKDRTRERTL